MFLTVVVGGMAGAATIGAMYLWWALRDRGLAVKTVRQELMALRAEMANAKELSDSRQRNFEREMVRSGALARANAELAEQVQKLQAERNLLVGRRGLFPVMTLHLN